MKKKNLSLLLATTIVAASLSGCASIPISKDLVGTGELLTSTESLTKLNDKQQASFIKSFNRKFGKQEFKTADMDLILDAEMEVGSSGFSLPVKMNIDDNIILDMENEKAYQKLNANIEVFGMKIDMDMDNYLVKENNDFISYSNMSSMGEESGWRKETVDKNIFENSNNNLIALNEDMIKGIYQTEEATQYLIEMDAEQLSALTESFNNQIADGSDFNIDLSDMSAYMTLDSGLEIVGYYADLANAVTASSEGVEMSMNSLNTSIKFNSINEEEEISLPKEAEKAVETSEENELPILPDVSSNVIPETNKTNEVNETTEANETESFVIDDNTVSLLPNLGNKDILLNGNKINIPCSLSQLKSYGIMVDEEVQLNPGDFEVVIGTMGGEDEFYLSIHNDTNNIISSNDATVKTINYDAYLVENPINYSVFGVKVGMSMNDVESILGEGINMYTGFDGYVSKDYFVDNYEIEIIYNDNMVSAIEISC